MVESEVFIVVCAYALKLVMELDYLLEVISRRYLRSNLLLVTI